jgi:hypothetical protein
MKISLALLETMVKVGWLGRIAGDHPIMRHTSIISYIRLTMSFQAS